MKIDRTPIFTKGTRKKRTADAPSAPSPVKVVPLNGTECPGLKKAIRTGEVNPTEQFEVSLMLKPARQLDLSKLKGALTPEEFVALYGARVEDIKAVRQFASKNGLQLTSEDRESGIIKLKGTASDYEKAFGIQLGNYKDAKLGEFRGYEGNVRVPQSFAKRVVGVFGFSTRPFCKPHSQFVPGKVGPLDSTKVSTSYSPLDIAKLYNFPQGYTGKGQKIGIVEFDGGYNMSDLQTFFQSLGRQTPSVTAESVDGAKNNPSGDPEGPDGEVELDIEILGAIVPDADIHVYFAPNTDQGSIDIVNQMIKDGCNLISQSWGGDESSQAPSVVQALELLFQQAAAKRITIGGASGDQGSSDGVGDGKSHADYIASSQYVLGCGATTLKSKNGAITSETVWNNSSGASGGAYSSIFPIPDWQKIANTNKMRGVCDVSGNGDPYTGFKVLIDNKWGVSGGTSAVVPLLIGLLGRINEALGHPVGFINPIIYTPQFAGAFYDITQGSNGAYKAKPGWDPPTGLGRPDGQKLLEAFQQFDKQGGNAFSQSKPRRFRHHPTRKAA